MGHQSCLLFNGNRLRDDRSLLQQIEQGAKLILFLRHHHNCTGCADPSIAPCSTERHVAVIIAEDLDLGLWDLRVVGGDKREQQKDDQPPASSNENEENITEQPWQQVRRALSSLHGEYDR